MENEIAVLHAGVGRTNTHSIENKQLVGFLASLPAILRGHGVEPLQVLAAAGLSAHALDDPNDSLASSNVVQLLALASEKTASPSLGLEIGGALNTSALGVIGELVRSAPTLRVALQGIAAHQHRYSPGSVGYLIEDKEKSTAVFGTAAYQPKATVTAMLSDSYAMAAVSLVRELAGSEPQPVVQVLLSRAEPADVQPYRHAFAADIRFNAEQTAVVLLASRLDQLLPGADAALHSSSLARARDMSSADDIDIVDRLRRSLRVALLRGKVSANQISVQLGMSRRTLHRRLDEAGVHYQEILDQTRCAFAQQLLADTTLRIGEVANVVGYTDPSALTRRFIRWTGMPPNEWRSRLKTNP